MKALGAVLILVALFGPAMLAPLVFALAPVLVVAGLLVVVVVAVRRR